MKLVMEMKFFNDNESLVLSKKISHLADDRDTNLSTSNLFKKQQQQSSSKEKSWWEKLHAEFKKSIIVDNGRIGVDTRHMAVPIETLSPNFDPTANMKAAKDMTLDAQIERDHVNNGREHYYENIIFCNNDGETGWGTESKSHFQIDPDVDYKRPHARIVTVGKIKVHTEEEVKDLCSKDAILYGHGGVEDLTERNVAVGGVDEKVTKKVRSLSMFPRGRCKMHDPPATEIFHTRRDIDSIPHLRSIATHNNINRSNSNMPKGSAEFAVVMAVKCMRNLMINPESRTRFIPSATTESNNSHTIDFLYNSVVNSTTFLGNAVDASGANEFKLIHKGEFGMLKSCTEIPVDKEEKKKVDKVDVVSVEDSSKECYDEKINFKNFCNNVDDIESDMMYDTIITTSCLNPTPASSQSSLFGSHVPSILFNDDDSDDSDDDIEEDLEDAQSHYHKRRSRKRPGIGKNMSKMKNKKQILHSKKARPDYSRANNGARFDSNISHSIVGRSNINKKLTSSVQEMGPNNTDGINQAEVLEFQNYINCANTSGAIRPIVGRVLAKIGQKILHPANKKNINICLASNNIKSMLTQCGHALPSSLAEAAVNFSTW